MWDNEPDISQIRESVKKRLSYRRSPIRVAIFAIVVSVIVANILTAVGRYSNAFPSWFPGLIAVLIIVSIVRSRVGWRRRSTPNDGEIERAVRRELRYRGYVADQADIDDDGDYFEKPKRDVQVPPLKRKNDAPVRLGDDGELVFDEQSPEESELTSQNS